MFKYKLIIEYDGTNFVGWQRQDNGPSIQQSLEEAIQKLANEQVAVFGSGRTDSGAHAKGQVAHFEISNDLAKDNIRDGINQHLRPLPIVILNVEKVAGDFHARFSAKQRIYEYSIINRRPPLTFKRQLAWVIYKKLDIEKIKEAALFFEGIYQFSIVIRNIINPEIAKLYVEKKFKDLIQLIRYSSILSLLLISIISAFLYYLFPYILFFVGNEIMIESRELLKYLIIGLFFYSLIIPSENLLFQSNNPLGQSLYMISLTLINILMNYVMINKFGIKGAAIGTAFVYFLSIIIFNLYIIFLTDLKRGIYLNAINLNKE